MFITQEAAEVLVIPSLEVIGGAGGGGDSLYDSGRQAMQIPGAVVVRHDLIAICRWCWRVCCNHKNIAQQALRQDRLLHLQTVVTTFTNLQGLGALRSDGAFCRNKFRQ